MEDLEPRIEELIETLNELTHEELLAFHTCMLTLVLERIREGSDGTHTG